MVMSVIDEMAEIVPVMIGAIISTIACLGVLGVNGMVDLRCKTIVLLVSCLVAFKIH
jgi:hypothetical protein